MPGFNEIDKVRGELRKQKYDENRKNMEPYWLKEDYRAVDRKPRVKKFDIDKAIRWTLPEGMTNGTETYLTIRFICGFELFGHYESWSTGYVVEGKGFSAQAEDLDVALAQWAKRYNARHGECTPNSIWCNVHGTSKQQCEGRISGSK